MQFKNINVTKITIEDEFCVGLAEKQFFLHYPWSEFKYSKLIQHQRAGVIVHKLLNLFKNFYLHVGAASNVMKTLKTIGVSSSRDVVRLMCQ